MAKQIVYGAQARQAVLRGIVTFGPGGRNVILGRGFGSPTLPRTV